MLSELDDKILKELEKNSRTSNIAIAKHLKISEGTVRKRIQKLMKAGIIKRFTIDIATKTGFSAIVLIKADPSMDTGKIVQPLTKIKDTKNIYETSGDYDVVVKVVTSSAEQFNDIIEKIRTTRGVKKTESLVILKIN